jgi:hypothetical protein
VTRARDLGLELGTLPSGTLDAITDGRNGITAHALGAERLLETLAKL